MSARSEKRDAANVSVRPVTEADLREARRIFRVAFGTFIGLPDPESFSGDREYIFTRWKANPASALAAEEEGQLAGSVFATKWGSFGVVGPVSVRPELWGRKIAQKLLEPAMDLFDKSGVREAGLFTFAHSAKHVGLYQKFGFWPRFLTALMSKAVNGREASATKYSMLDASAQDEALRACRHLTDAVYDGLDVSSEIRSVHKQNLGETLLVWGGDSLDAFAVCHCGAGTEAGADNCYVKFAAVQPGPSARAAFERLLDVCEAYAAGRGIQHLEAGVNLNRSSAYRQMLQRGFRTMMQGVAMHRPDTPAYNRKDAFIIDDLR